MKKETILKISFTALILASLLPTSANAAGLSVVFEQNPLFSDANIAPGTVVSRTVEVHNGNASTEAVDIEALNTIDSDGLGDALIFTVTESGSTVYSDTLASFFAAGQQSLTTLAAGATTTYTISLDFPISSANAYQGATTGFDLCIGFEGGTQSCDGSTGTGGGGTTTSGGGGGGGGILPQTLQIFNEAGTGIPPTSGLIVWETNLPASTQVIYGLQSGGPYALDLNDPNYGYPLATSEDSTLVTTHAATLPGLVPGETYVYRIVSREGPTSAPTISPEYTLTLATAQPLALTTFSPTTPGGAGAGEGATGGVLGGGGNFIGTTGGDAGSAGEDGEGGESTAGESNNNQLAAAFLGLPDEIVKFFSSFDCVIWLLALVIFTLITIWFVDRKRRWFELPNLEQRFRQLATAEGIFLAALGVAFVFGKECLYAPIILISGILLILLLLTFFRKRGK